MRSTIQAKKWVAACLCSALVLSGCASTRGGQDFACADFATFAEAPAPNRFVLDIQRYGVENRGANAPDVRLPGLESLAGEPVEPPPTGIEKVVQDVAFGGADDAALEAEGKRIQAEYERRKSAAQTSIGLESSIAPAAPELSLPTRNLMLLSGGGQWGAFGAGLFLGMACPREKASLTQRNTMPCVSERMVDGEMRIVIDPDTLDFSQINAMQIGSITGVSTGGLQSLLLMVVLDGSQPQATREAVLEQLLNSYAPQNQSDLVDYDGYGALLFKGSIAGTDPLVAHVKGVIEETYEFNVPGMAGTREMRLVDHISTSPIETVVGIVEANDGRFKYVNMKDMVDAINRSEEEPAARAQAVTQCVLAATLASSAMPAFHQQVRVIKADGPDDDAEPDTRTLFDGGVRRSVFVSNLAQTYGEGIDAITAQLSPDALEAAIADEVLPKIYVLRNGPTTSKFDTKVDEVDGAVNQALRAYSLLVNELEVSSIASLRLINPYGPIKISTADGSEDPELQFRGKPENPRKACQKKGTDMFRPTFMRCLQNFGARRGMGLENDANGAAIKAFWSLRTVPLPDSDGPE